MNRPTRPTAFTLVELLVVISIIVVLLAMLVPAVTRALKMADKAKCAVNQRNIAQALAGYASADAQKNMPPAVLGKDTTAANSNNQTIYRKGTFAYAMDYRVTEETWVKVGLDSQEYLADATPVRDVTPIFGFVTPGLITFPLPRLPIHGATGNIDNPGGTGVNAGMPLGLGVLVAAGILPSTKLGEIAHCPSLNTASSAVADFGTDNVYTVTSQNAQSGTTTTSSSAAAAGGSFFIDPAQNASRIIGSYNYRALSFALMRGGSASIKVYDSTSSFVTLTDLLDVRFGRKFHHVTGYNVSYGDGSTRFLEDKLTKDPDGREFGDIERKIPGFNTTPTPIDGRTGYNTQANTSVDEELFEKHLVSLKK